MVKLKLIKNVYTTVFAKLFHEVKWLKSRPSCLKCNEPILVEAEGMTEKTKNIFLEHTLFRMIATILYLFSYKVKYIPSSDAYMFNSNWLCYTETLINSKTLDTMENLGNE